MVNKRIVQTLNVKVVRGNGQDRQTLGQIPREDKHVTHKWKYRLKKTLITDTTIL